MEAAVIGSSIIGGLSQANAARRAANIQAGAAREAAQSQLQATRESNALNYAMYLQGLQNQAPFMRGGQAAYAALLGGMGLGNIYQQPGAAVAGGQPATTMPVRARPLEGGGAAQPAVMPQGEPVYDPDTGALRYTTTPGTVPGTAAGPGTVTGGTGLFDPTQLPTGLQPRNVGATPEELAGAAGQYAGQFQQTFKPSDIYTDPSYQWRVEQGLRALKASRAATGMLQTGQGLQDIVNYGQQAGAQEYQSAYDRFMRNQEAAFNRLSTLAGAGQTATGAATQAGTAAGQQIGSNIMAGQRAASDYLTGAAASQAAGAVGQANAITGAMGGGLQNWMALQYLNRPSIGYTPGAAAAGGGSMYGAPPGLKLGGPGGP